MTVIVSDTFSGEGADVDLDTHTPDTVGTGWTNIETTGTRSIFVETATPANVIRAEGPENSDRTLYTAQGAYAGNEYDVEIDIVNTDTSDDWAFLLGRLTDSSNYYAAGFIANANVDLRLVKKVANVFSNLGTADSDLVASGATIKLEIRDANKKIFIDDVEQFADNDDALTSTGEGGVAFGNILTATFDIGSGWDLNNFLIEDTAVPPALPVIPLVMAPYIPA